MKKLTNLTTNNLKLLAKIQKDYKIIFVVFFISRTILTLSAFIAHQFSGNFSTIYNLWAAWDSNWYNKIATEWYSSKVADGILAGQANYAFFPLYPGSLKIFGVLFNNNYYLAGFILSNIFFIVGLIFFYKFLLFEITKKQALIACLFVLLFPTSFIFSAVMSESLFFMLTAICLWLAKKNNWLGVGIAGLLLSLTRSVGVLIFIPIIFEYIKSKNITWSDYSPRKLDYKFLFLGLIPLGFFLFMYYIYTLTNDPFAILTIQKAWGREFVNPIFQLLNWIFTRDPLLFFLSSFTTTFLILIVLNLKKIKWSYWLYGILMILIPMSNTSNPSLMTSMPRYILVVFPIYIIIAQLTDNYPRTRYSLYLIFFILQVVLMNTWSMEIPIVV